MLNKETLKTVGMVLLVLAIVGNFTPARNLIIPTTPRF